MSQSENAGGDNQPNGSLSGPIGKPLLEQTTGQKFFGQGDGYLVDQSRKALENGLPIGGKTYKVDLLDRDSQSDPARAGQVAKGLISDNKIDFMLVTSTPEVVNPVADAAKQPACLAFRR